MQALQRPDWRGQPVYLGDLFRLTKDRSGRAMLADCKLFSHQLGWELRLDVAGTLQRSQVCRSQDDVLSTSEQWKTAMQDKGWR